jgi:hypothetical protein
MPYGLGRVRRPSSRTSRNPAVVISPQRAPLRSSTAFVATVVPWTSAATAARSVLSTASPSMKPTDWSSGVEGTLATRNTPRSGSSASRSVNVPPTSAPICHAIRYSSPSCRASWSLTRISAPGPAAQAVAPL